MCFGAIHPAFQRDSSNRRVRSGVGVDAAGKVVFVLSETPTTFHAFAALFRDRLGCPDALYLDGEISCFYFPGVDADGSREFAGIFVVTRKLTRGVSDARIGEDIVCPAAVRALRASPPHGCADDRLAASRTIT